MHRLLLCHHRQLLGAAATELGGGFLAGLQRFVGPVWRGRPHPVQSARCRRRHRPAPDGRSAVRTSGPSARSVNSSCRAVWISAPARSAGRRSRPPAPALRSGWAWKRVVLLTQRPDRVGARLVLGSRRSAGLGRAPCRPAQGRQLQAARTEHVQLGQHDRLFNWALQGDARNHARDYVHTSSSVRSCAQPRWQK